MSLALWLRTGRTERGLSLDDVARVTKIQPRILERLEGGKLDGLPAEVFVRGFIRSFAKCCGLDEAEALSRYSAASQAQAIATAPMIPSTLSATPAVVATPVATPTVVATPVATPAARAMVEAMADLAPQVARTTSTASASASVSAIEVVELAQGSLPAISVPVEASAAVTTERPSKKKHRGKKRAKRATSRQDMALGTPSTAMPVVAAIPAETIPAETISAETISAEQIPAEAMSEPISAVPVVEAAPVESASVEAAAVETTANEPAPVIVDHLDPLVEPPADDGDVVATETWQPKMPPATTTASVPWRRPAYVATSTAAASVPTLVIDDADPEHAAQVLEDREAAKSVLTNAQRRSFLPPILLDREDRSARQGGLTLAVIILLIAATLTLSYLMRRPSSSGDGVTSIDVETQLVG